MSHPRTLQKTFVFTPQQKRLAAAVSLALMALAVPNFVQAQAAPKTAEELKKEAEAKAAAEKKTQSIETITVTGLRASLEKSIETKRNADTNVEVVTAEDIGKMPDKNIADALSRLSGVNVQYGGALALDEAERVAIRGTSPNLNLVTVNGHALSSGDWHVGDQAGSGRSVGFSLMPSQLIGQSIVYKNGRADITEGGISGTVDIRTRRPLDFKKQFTGEVSIGAVHAELAKKTDPQASGLLAWKNDAGNLAMMVQAYKEKRSLRRDGQETFGFNYITTAQANASGNAQLIAAAQAAAASSTPTITDVRMPGSLNSALFKGERDREGGFFGVQFKPTKNIDLNFTAFRSTLQADNYNSSAFGLPNTLLNNGWLIRNPVIENNVLVSASLERPSNAAATQQVVGLQFDHNLRQGAKSLSSFYDVDFKFTATDALSFDGRAGYTEGFGKTNSQPSLTFGIINPNIRYTINTGRPTDYAILNSATGQPINLSTTASYAQLSNTGAAVASTDEEKYLHLNGMYKFSSGMFTNVKFGVRTAKHDREYEVIGARFNAQDNATGPVTPSPFISVTGGLLVTNIVGNNVPVPATSYPSNWAAGLSGSFPRNLFRFDPAQLQAFANQYVNWDPVKNKIWSSGYTVKEKNDAAYVMTDFDLDKVSGNIGARFVSTEVDSLAYQALPAGTGVGQCTALAACSVPGAIVGSRFATYLPQRVVTKHTTVLPSFNLRFDVDAKTIARFSVSKTLGRPNYNELAGAVTLNNTLLTGTSGNPNLKPTTATNTDLSIAHFFGKNTYISGAIFSQNIKDYVKPGISTADFFNTATGTTSTFTVTSRIGVRAKVRGVEVSGEAALGGGFGVQANATYVDAKDADNQPFLGTSQLTYNLVGYYEGEKLSSRLAWNYRTDYAIGFATKPGVVTTVGTHRYTADGSLSASIGYKFYKDFSINLDGNNLLDPIRHTYFINESAPGYWHQNGRQYFLTLRGKF
jgi:iron complex outermembrane recepter protein